MAKSRSRSRAVKSKKDSVTLTREVFIGVVLFVIAVTIFITYAYLNYTGIK